MYNIYLGKSRLELCLTNTKLHITTILIDSVFNLPNPKPTRKVSCQPIPSLYIKTCTFIQIFTRMLFYLQNYHVYRLDIVHLHEDLRKMAKADGWWSRKILRETGPCKSPEEQCLSEDRRNVHP